MIESAMSFRPEDQLRIPTRAGVYAFCFNPFRKSNLGLFEGEVHADAEIVEAKLGLKRKLQKFETLKSKFSLTGRLDFSNPYDRLQHTFQGTLIGKAVGAPSVDLAMLSNEEFLLYLELAAVASPLSQPIYCGMTVEQDLRARYTQHLKNYELARQRTFGGRLAESGIAWPDLTFVCSPATFSSNSEASIKMLERHMMFLFNPIMSVR